MTSLELFSQRFAELVWGTPLVVLLLGGGCFFLILSRALPYRHLGHALNILLCRFETPYQPG